MSNRLEWSSIDPAADFRFSAPKATNKQGGFSVAIEVCDNDTGMNKRFVHQAPPLSLPFGISSKPNPDGSMRTGASFTFPTVRMDPQTGEYHGEENILKYMKFLMQIEVVNKKKAFEQCKTWFKKSMLEEVVDELYFSAVFVSDKVRSGDYSPTFTCKIEEVMIVDKNKQDALKKKKASGETVTDENIMKKNTRATTFFACNEETKEISVSDMGCVGKRRKVVPLLESTGMWFAGKQFGMQFRVLQMLFYEENDLVGFAIDMGAASEYIQVDRPVIKNGDSDEESDEVVSKKRPSEMQITEGPVSKVAAFNLPSNE